MMKPFELKVLDLPAKPKVDMPNLDGCQHPGVNVLFDEKDFRKNKLSATEVVKKYPRKHCSLCGSIVYASYMHYIAGDW